MNWKKDNCIPKNIDAHSSETSIHINLQDVLDHQVSKLLTPEIKDKMKVLASQGAKFELHVKYGMSIQGLIIFKYSSLN